MQLQGSELKKGVIIEAGAAPWQIFQQNEQGFAAISLRGTAHRVRQSFELPLTFSEIPDGAITVKARIALESSGESVCPWSICQTDDNGRWSITFPRVPAGGPYRVETYMEYQGWDGLSSTRGDMIHNIGVGDIFVVAGQSNAAGRAKNPVEDAPELGIHLLRASGVWDLATHPLGETTGSVYQGHFENHNPGHTPWLHFAKLLRRELGYPIGIVMSAYGGAPLRWWNPEENGSLYRNMLEQLSAYALHPKAVLWYQGEAEGYENAAETYLSRFSQFVHALRRDLEQPELPFITVQLNRCMTPCDTALDRQWGLVRQAQVDAARTIPGVYILPSSDVALYDFIHNSAQGNLVIAERCARCALAELYGKQLMWQAPEVFRAEKTAPDTLVLHFSRICNWLNPFDVAASLLPFDAEDAQGLVHCVSYEAGNDTLTLRFPRALDSAAVVHGVWRTNPGPCTPCDCMRMPMLSFYALPVTESERCS